MAVEQPPIDVATDLKAYLVRVLQTIDIKLRNNGKIPIASARPTKPVRGKIYYFEEGVIGLEGLYVYKSTGWEYIA